MSDQPNNPRGDQEHSPAWWTDDRDASWSMSRKGTLAAWRPTDATNALDEQAAEAAMEFGHKAHQHYDSLHRTWSQDLESRLKADWKAAGAEATYAWEKVRDAVKHGWDRARDAVQHTVHRYT